MKHYLHYRFDVIPYTHIFHSYIKLEHKLTSHYKIFQSMSDLLVIGAGVLGMLVARRWRTLHPSANVTLKFRSVNTERNAEMEKGGFKIITKEGDEKLVNPLVVFCAPPTGNNDYAEVSKHDSDLNMHAPNLIIIRISVPA